MRPLLIVKHNAAIDRFLLLFRAVLSSIQLLRLHAFEKLFHQRVGIRIWTDIISVHFKFFLLKKVWLYDIIKIYLINRKDVL